MPAKSRGFSKINLVPQDEFDKSLLGKVMKWSLTAGKSIVILTEFVVILAFLSRFKLDRDLNDISEVVMQKQAIVTSYELVEIKMRDLQARADILIEVNKGVLQADVFLQDLSSKTPFNVQFESVKYTVSQLDLAGSAGSEEGFAKLISGIRSDEKWGRINLGEVEFDQRKGGVVFAMSARESEIVAKK